MSGALSHSPARIISDMLIDLGLASAVGGSWPVYTSVLPSSPDEAMSVVNTSGKHLGRAMVGGRVFQSYGFQMMFRSLSDESAWTKANNVTIAFDESVYDTYVPIGSYTYLVHSMTRTGAILYVGFDETTRRRLYTINGFACLKQLPGTGSY